MKLSSDLTFFSKFILPGIPIGLIGFFLPIAITDGGFAWVPVAMGIIIGTFAVGWAWSIKVVEIHGDQFSISNFRSTHLVPISHLCYFEEDRMNRTPSIVLYFDPPTPYGKCLKFIPPNGPFLKGMTPFNEICDWLKEVLKSRSETPH